MNSWTAVILAAGKGTRMNSRVPKVLHPLCGQPMLAMAIGNALDANHQRILVVVPPKAEDIRTTIKLSVEYIVQDQPHGTGHALLQALPALKDTDNIHVLHGDVPLLRPETLSRMIALHIETEATVTLLTSSLCPPGGLGRVLRDSSGSVKAVVEERDADTATLAISEINSGVYCFQVRWLKEHLKSLSPSASNEIYLTDLIAAAAGEGQPIETVESHDRWEVLGINDRVQLAQAESAMRQRIRECWMLAGVTMVDPDSVFIDVTAQLGQDTVVYPNTHIRGDAHIGAECHIGPNSIVDGSIIGDRCRILSSTVEGSIVEDDVEIGPYSHIRTESYIERDVHIGNYAEVKKSRLGSGTRMGHFSYIGDAILGSNVNVGAGTITCNYDGVNKNETLVGDDVFIGSDTMLVAPIKLGARSTTGAGSVVTKDVPADTLVVGAPARIVRKQNRRPKS